ncbi:MAG: tetratricopeptide repeat protein [Balneolaceae bacterium]|nr:tetratricopeptide repeat protein [Balneolaceae bacterium]
MKLFKPFLFIIAAASLLWACEATDPLVNEVQLFMVTGEYEQALDVVNAAIAEDETNYVAHYYKGEVLVSQAETLDDPRRRLELYEQARSSFNRAKELMEGLEERPDEYEQLEESVTFYWAEEFNSGVNIVNNDSVAATMEQPNVYAIAHFQNAATIQPDSALSYIVLSSVQFNNGMPEQAIENYETAMTLLDPPAVDDYEYMISILLNQERYDRAVMYAEEAMEIYPEESIFVQLLADAFLQTGQQDRAIDLIEGLIAEEPNNPQYRRVLGTQIYQRVSSIADQVSEMYEEAFEMRRELDGLSGNQRTQMQNELEELQAEITELEQEMDELTEISIREMERVVELEPDSESAHSILGIIYQNRAASLFERRNNTVDNDVAQQLDNEARQNLQEALIYYERAAELDPDDTETWQSLFQVYTTLGMEEKAMEAMEKAGL